jgi:hypothetical protein
MFWKPAGILSGRKKSCSDFLLEDEEDETIKLEKLLLIASV